MPETERRYTVKSLSISRWGNDGPYKADVNVHTASGHEIKVQLPPERVNEVVDVVADLILEALIAQFTNMREDHEQGLLEAKAKEEQRLLEASAESS